MKSTIYTRELYLDTLLAIEGNPQWNDQEAFWQVITDNIKQQIIYTYGSCTDHYLSEIKQLIGHHYPKTHPASPEKSIVMCSLDPCIFANGILAHDKPINETLFDRIDPIVMVHATAIFGGVEGKQSRLQHFDFWLANVTDTETAEYTCNVYQRNGQY